MSGRADEPPDVPPSETSSGSSSAGDGEGRAHAIARARQHDLRSFVCVAIHDNGSEKIERRILGAFAKCHDDEHDRVLGSNERQSFRGAGVELELVLRIEDPRRDDDKADVGLLRR
jgi:hypothetical protein